MKREKRFFTNIVMSSLACTLLVSVVQAKPSNKREKKCTRLPGPPKNVEDRRLLEGQNCICCFEKCDLPSEKRNLNANKVCLSYKEMCKSYKAPIDSQPILFPDKLTYTPDPAMVGFDGQPVPPCQKIVFPPPVDNPLSVIGKHVLVIGGSKGFGKAVAERFAKEGAKVIATSRHPECHKKPKRYKLRQLDVRFEKEVERFVEHVACKCFDGKIDILVNCPMIDWHGPLSDGTGDDLTNGLEIGLIGYHRVTHYALPFMRHSDDTRVISFGSLAGSAILTYAAGVYSIVKRGLQAWNDVLQIEELTKKAQGLICFGPTFSLMEPSTFKTSFCLYERFTPSGLATDDPLVAAQDVLCAQGILGLGGILASNPVERAAEAVFRVAVAPQPGVRYAVVGRDEMVTLPGVGEIPVLAALQGLNLLSADDAINLLTTANVPRLGDVERAQEAVINALCPNNCKDKRHKRHK